MWHLTIGQSHKSHNANVPYPTIHHFETEMCTFLFQSGALWDMRLVCGFVNMDCEASLVAAMEVNWHDLHSCTRYVMAKNWTADPPAADRSSCICCKFKLMKSFWTYNMIFRFGYNLQQNIKIRPFCLDLNVSISRSMSSYFWVMTMIWSVANTCQLPIC